MFKTHFAALIAIASCRSDWQVKTFHKWKDRARRDPAISVGAGKN
jgi:hypothetical protein